MEYIVGLTEQELEFYYNRSTGLSNWSELDETSRMEVKMNTESFIRDMMFTRFYAEAMHAAKHREKASSDS